MKIRTNLLLLAATFVILITLTGLIMLNAFGLINREIQASNRASRMIKDISELDIVTYEYLMHHEKRMQQQWLLKYDSLGKHLDEMRKEGLHPESLSIIEFMTADYKSFGALFSQLQVNFAKREILIEENKTQTKVNPSVAVEERLIAEVLMRSHDITANAFKLSAVLESEVAQTQQRSNLIIMFSIIGFAIFSSYISFLTIRAITKPINELIKGAEIIGTGDLEHKIELRTKNEIGQLGNSFNKMTKDLKEIIVSRDKLDKEVTERKKAEEKIKASLKEKEVLLKEVHHRVKNNMQIISSLFSLQSGRIKDKQALEIFKSSQNRVRSMALIHERLYKSKDLAGVDFAEYTQGLTTHLLSSYGINTNAIKLYINIKDVFLDINTAIPCSLIINELVSNSLKHAFPGGKKGEIKIAGHPLNKNEIELVVSDNGVGIPKEVDFRKTESLGLHLINLLAEDQLYGDIKLDRTKGTSFHIRFKVKQ